MNAFPDELERPAATACRRSAALGSALHRGAALLAASGRIHASPEVPNESGVGACAERVVVWQAVQAGDRRFRALLIRGGPGGSRDGGPPCGACLQVLAEFSPGMRIWWGTKSHPLGGLTVRELLPGAFGNSHLVAPGSPASAPRKARNASTPRRARSASIPPGARSVSTLRQARRASISPGARSVSTLRQARSASIPPGARSVSTLRQARRASISPRAGGPASSSHPARSSPSAARRASGAFSSSRRAHRTEP